ncbi:MAG: 16S rRNA (cytosine(1402)-N(4))-methyltransferase RsmH [Christensenellales bacterium]|jgi:16S rRNA (cytosine1402-N4)-methyltransferase
MSEIMSGASGYHVPVMLEEVMEYLLKGGGLYVDGTLGGGGHSLEILRRQEGAVLAGIDRDLDAIDEAGRRLSVFGGRFRAIHGNYADMEKLLAKNGFGKAEGILLDLGVSSHQFDDAARGFSYHEDAPLDMRMDATQPFSARDIVNEYSESELSRVIFSYGEERWAKRIAEFIVARRPINTTLELVETIKAAVPKGARRDGPHPARRTFQAIRIEVNQELEKLKGALYSALNCLNAGGRLCVITFHSLEDRIVKQTFSEMQNPCTCPKDIPICICKKEPVARVITRKPVLPSKGEIERNARSRSAKLRVAEKI